MLIATRRIKSHAEGAVKWFTKGEEVTGLSTHDEAALVRCGALRDTVEERMQAEFDRGKAKMALTTFDDARRVVQARAESIAPSPALPPLPPIDDSPQEPTLPPAPVADPVPAPVAALQAATPPTPDAEPAGAPQAATPPAPDADAKDASAPATRARPRKQG